MVKGPSVEWLISNGFLSRYKLFVPSTVDMSNVKKTMGDFNKKQVRNIVDKPTITGSAIEEYKKLGGRKKTVVFAASIEHSKHIVEQFISSGINAVHLDGETETKLRDETMQSFKEGKIDVISNVDLFGEGFDCPTIEVAILLRPTASTALYLQQVGRALRPSPGKQWAYILDHVGNCQRHGLPDEFRDWSLEGHSSKRTKSDSTVRVKICPKCFAAQGPGTSCKYCGYFFPINTRLQDIKQEKGELQEVDLEKIKKSRKAEQSQAQTVNDLIVIAKNRGYNNPSAWAYHVYRARMKRYA
jgi:superfamily II DNA or RNA helicase